MWLWVSKLKSITLYLIFFCSLSETEEVDFLFVLFALVRRRLEALELESEELSSLLELESDVEELTEVDDELLTPWNYIWKWKRSILTLKI